MEIGEYKCEVCPHKNKWIPCSRKLPKEMEPVIVTATGEESGVFISYFDKTTGLWMYDTTDGYKHIVHVEAWMSIPEPYEVSGDEV